MAYQFGQTWWGNEWLRSLDEIDYSNRLPRGRSYAGRGMVKSISVKGNMITAKVQGSRRTPYKVVLVVPPFFDDDIKRLVDELLRHPIIIAQLLNRELSPAVLDIAGKLGLRVFPQRWTDFKMQCSCPDWAVPCKHLAAVIYMMSREIDNNPFLVFEMHRVDLLGELAKRGITIEAKKMMAVAPAADALDTVKASPASTLTPEKLDFSRLSDITAPLVDLLSEAPSFYPGADFRAIYRRVMTRTAKACRNVFTRAKHAPVFAEGELSLSHHDSVAIEVDRDLRLKVIVSSLNHEHPDLSFDSIEPLMSALNAIRVDFLDDYQPSVAALKQSLMCAVHLLANGAVVPQLLRLSDKSYCVRWTPATIDEQVKTILLRLETWLPRDMVTARVAPRRRPQQLGRPAHLVVSCMLSEILHFVNYIDYSQPLYVDDVERMFFAQGHPTFSGVGQSEVPGSIKAWLDRYAAVTGEFVPIFVVEEELHGLNMTIKISYTDENGEYIVDLAQVPEHSYLARRQYAIYKNIASLGSIIPALNGYVDSGGAEQMRFDLPSFTPVLLSAIPALRLLGMTVVLPKALMKLLRPLPTVKLGAKSASSPSFMRLDTLLDFKWQVALGNNAVSLDEFMKLLGNARGLMRFKGQYVYVSDDDIARLNKTCNEKNSLTPSQMLQAAISEQLNSVPVTLTDDVRRLMKSLTRQESIPVPANLHATLRPYQERGFSWMFRNMRLGFGSIIADDMGLGKTLQVITLILHLKNEGALDKERVLIVVPTGLLSNWVTEIERFAPSLTSFVYHGTGRDIKRFRHDVMLTSYGVMRADVAALKKKNWALLVIDEAQNIKNSDTNQSKAARGIKAGCYIAMSGTPVENRLSEFWSIMDFANKGYLGTEKAFEKEYAKPIQLSGDFELAEQFRKITAPFMLRRVKTDKSIISDLPDKIEQNDFAHLTLRQAALYEETLEASMRVINEIDDTDAGQLFKRQGLVLQMIMALKQICNHPAQFLKNDDRDPELSGKAVMLLDLVESVVINGEKVLVFTQYREMGELLRQFVAKRLGSEPLFYHGGCSIKQRNEIVDRFQNNRADRVLILSLKAAGTGLNLTAASHVIHYDLWWNPAVEAQATDRAYRIGQHNNVIVHRFITADTFEQRIDAMIQSKKSLAEMTVATGETWLGRLSNTELNAIFSRPTETTSAKS